MSHVLPQWLAAHAGPVLMVCALATLLLRRARLRWQLLASGAMAVLVCVPFDGLSAAQFARGWIGDLSITSLLLLGAAVWGGFAGKPLLRRRDLWAVFGFAAAAGMFLYPMTLGLGSFDPYELGFAPWWLLGVLLALAITGGVRGNRAAVLVPVVILAWWAGLLESTNLWDYMLDPLLAIFSLVWIIAAAIRGLVARRSMDTALKQ